VTDEYRVDDLARLSGMTVRNIREHQSRGLLPAPEVRGRVGYYGPEHLARLEQIKRLQAEGFTLDSIRKLLGGGAEFASFASAVHRVFEDEERRVVTMDDIHTLFPHGGHGEELLTAAVELGLLRPLGNGRYEERSPSLTRIGSDLMTLGIPPQSALRAAADALPHVQAIADSFVRIYIDHIWTPFEAAGYPAESWPEIVSGLERLRPLALDSVIAMLRLALDQAASAAIEARAGLE
jgi:DNA-binding transcriptional MerR regulator